MKKIFILTFSIISFNTVIAQRIHNATEHSVGYVIAANCNSINAKARTTAAGDTLTLRHIISTDTMKSYTLGTTDSMGFVTGPNSLNDRAFAERYDITGADSSVKVLGLMALFTGKVNPASTHTINFAVWNQTTPISITGGMLYNGFPDTILTSEAAPVTQLGIGTTTDTLKRYMFTTPTSLLYSSFFVGYKMAYNFSSINGDLFGLATTKHGHRRPTADFTLVYNTSTADTTLDTFVNVQNATLGSDNVWYDNYTQNDSLKNNMAIYPIVVIWHAAGVAGVTRNNLTMYGNYPNPATSSTTISYSLKHQSSVSIQLMDMAGHIIKSINEVNITEGTHSLLLPTDDLASGDYLYLIRTADGDGIAGKMTKI